MLLKRKKACLSGGSFLFEILCVKLLKTFISFGDFLSDVGS